MTHGGRGGCIGGARHLGPLLCWVLAAQAVAAPGDAGQCQARSGLQPVQLVELYTSEGCSSCPPADRWLSGLLGQPGVLAVAFHVDYWDRLGWPDRWAQPAFTARQQQVSAASGARFVYTPQVLVNGRDWRGWPSLPRGDGAPAVVQLALRRQAAGAVQVSVQALAGAPPRLGLWWALLEDGHRTVVKAGENQGATLRHDHVVRRWVDELAQPAGPNAWVQWQLAAPRQVEAGRPARLLVVVTDAAGGRPLQAAQLDC